MADGSLWTDTAVGPVSYTTGGMVITTTLATVVNFSLEVQTVGANLGQSLFDITLNSPAAGQVTVKVLQEMFDRQTTIGAVTGLPASVTSRSSSGGTYNTASHTHNLDHDHALATSSQRNNSSGGVVSGVATDNIASHTHSFNPPNFTGTPSSSEATHTHTWDSIYQHAHSLTNTATDLSTTELANGTDLSGTTFIYQGTDT